MPRREVSDSYKRVSLLQHDNIYLSDSLLQCFIVQASVWKYMTATNALAYYSMIIFTAGKSLFNLSKVNFCEAIVVASQLIS